MSQLRTATLAALALAASGLACAQAGDRVSRSPYYRNHQHAATAPGATAGTTRGVHEDLDGTVISNDDAVQLCDRLSDARRRQDCVSNVSSDAGAAADRGDSGAMAPAERDRDDSQPAR